MNKTVVPLKIVILVFCALLAGAALLSSCSDDNNKSKPKGNFKIGSSAQSLYGGVLFYDVDPSYNAEEELYYRNEILLFSDGLKPQEEEDGEVEVLGKGDALSIEIVSSSNELEAGTYVWGSEDDPQEFQVWDASAYVNFDTSTGTGDRYSFTEMELTITKEDDKYTITFSGVVYPTLIVDGDDWGPDLEADPINVTGTYTGLVHGYSAE